jgi:hypothetical protein
MSSITRLRSGTTARVIYTFGAVAVLRMLDALSQVCTRRPSNKRIHALTVDASTTSFSTHSADTPYERENGVESQWQRYAADGFCLVFDTNRFGDCLASDFDRFDFTHLNLEDVCDRRTPTE